MTTIHQVIDQAKAQGFDVYAPASLTSYFYFTKAGHIGYCQLDRMHGVQYSTVHKPNKYTGTGFAASSFDDALCSAPAWATSRDADTVRKYVDWQDFSSKHWQPLTQM